MRVSKEEQESLLAQQEKWNRQERMERRARDEYYGWVDYGSYDDDLRSRERNFGLDEEW